MVQYTSCYISWFSHLTTGQKYLKSDVYNNYAYVMFYSCTYIRWNLKKTFVSMLWFSASIVNTRQDITKDQEKTTSYQYLWNVDLELLSSENIGDSVDLNSIRNTSVCVCDSKPLAPILLYNNPWCLRLSCSKIHMPFYKLIVW